MNDAVYKQIRDAEQKILEPCEPARYRALQRMAKQQDNYLALGLGGLGVPGIVGNIALLGVLEELDLRDRVQEIWGTSSGAAAGGVWSSGATAGRMLQLMDRLGSPTGTAGRRSSLPRSSAFRFLLLGEVPEGFAHGKNYRRMLSKTLESRTFEECRHRFRAIACTDDGQLGKVVFREGPLLEAIIASLSLPGLFSPVPSWTGDQCGYIDGGGVEKTPLVSILEEHRRLGRSSRLVVLCAHHSHSARAASPRGFVQRLCTTYSAMGDTIWDSQLTKVRDDAECDVVVLNPLLPGGDPFDVRRASIDYLWARQRFKEQLADANVAHRFHN